MYQIWSRSDKVKALLDGAKGFGTFQDGGVTLAARSNLTTDSDRARKVTLGTYLGICRSKRERVGSRTQTNAR